MTERWLEVRRCAGLHEAESLRARLARAGIAARVPEPAMMGWQPACAERVPAARLLVPEAQVERARQILDRDPGGS